MLPASTVDCENCFSEQELELLTPQEKLEAVKLLESLERLNEQNKIDSYYPETGPLRRELYPKHMAFFAAGSRYRERCFLAANRVGKTEGVGAYEVTLHLTGRYPDWWPGRRFERAGRWWAAGSTGISVRDIIQTKLLGPKDHFGTGMIPAQYLGRTAPKQGIADAVETIYVKHVSGKYSRLVLKTYEQGVKNFPGTEQDGIWLDEEPPYDIYVECVLRTMTTNGMILCTFMPLEGATEMVRHFMPELGGVE